MALCNAQLVCLVFVKNQREAHKWFWHTLICAYMRAGTVAALEKEHREASAGCEASEPDQTIEILMSDLDPEVMSIFTRAHSETAAQATKVRHRWYIVFKEI